MEAPCRRVGAAACGNVWAMSRFGVGWGRRYIEDNGYRDAESFRHSASTRGLLNARGICKCIEESA